MWKIYPDPQKTQTPETQTDADPRQTRTPDRPRLTQTTYPREDGEGLGVQDVHVVALRADHQTADPVLVCRALLQRPDARDHSLDTHTHTHAHAHTRMRTHARAHTRTHKTVQEVLSIALLPMVSPKVKTTTLLTPRKQCDWL